MMPASAATAGSDGGDRPAPYSSASAIVGGTVTGHHQLQIEGYSYIKEKLPNDKKISSNLFTVGDHQWRLRYFPNGSSSDEVDYVSVYLELVAIATGLAPPVKARAKLNLLDRAGKPVPACSRDTGMHEYNVDGCAFGYGQFIKRELLEKSEHLRDDSFTIRCDVTVVKELRTEDRTAPVVEVPPSDLHRHLGGLLESMDGADVTFCVAGEEVRAHRYVLAARSPVFKAELFGPMKEAGATMVVKVDDMEAEVFRSLLAFIYTDALPEANTKQKQEDELVMAQHLLVAADRYGLERLMLLCEEKLCVLIDRGSVATLMALAEQHHCRGLKVACFRFLDSTTTLNAVMETDGFNHLAMSCPSLVKDLVLRIADRH